MTEQMKPSSRTERTSRDERPPPNPLCATAKGQAWPKTVHVPARQPQGKERTMQEQQALKQLERGVEHARFCQAENVMAKAHSPHERGE